MIHHQNQHHTDQDWKQKKGWTSTIVLVVVLVSSALCSGVAYSNYRNTTTSTTTMIATGNLIRSGKSKHGGVIMGDDELKSKSNPVGDVVNDGCEAGLCWDNTICAWISLCDIGVGEECGEYNEFCEEDNNNSPPSGVPQPVTVYMNLNLFLIKETERCQTNWIRAAAIAAEESRTERGNLAYEVIQKNHTAYYLNEIFLNQEAFEEHLSLENAYVWNLYYVSLACVINQTPPSKEGGMVNLGTPIVNGKTNNTNPYGTYFSFDSHDP